LPGARSSPLTARRANAGLFFSEPYKGGGEGTKWRFIMSRRLNTPNGAFQRVIAAVMEIENFDRLYRTIDVGEGGFINLRARDGTIITRFPILARRVDANFRIPTSPLRSNVKAASPVDDQPDS